MFWLVWDTADSGGLPLSPALPLEVRGGRGRDQPPAGQGAGVSPLHRSLEDSNVDLFVVRGSTSPSPTLRTSALPSRATESPS